MKQLSNKLCVNSRVKFSVKFSVNTEPAHELRVGDVGIANQIYRLEIARAIGKAYQCLLGEAPARSGDRHAREAGLLLYSGCAQSEGVAARAVPRMEQQQIDDRVR